MHQSPYDPELADEDALELAGDRALELFALPVISANKVTEAAALLTARSVVANKRKKIFLVTLAKTGSIGTACTYAGWSRSTAQYHRTQDTEFAERWEQAHEYSIDLLEIEMRRRAVEGVSRPIFQQKELVGHETVYSDMLLLAMIKAKRREYREHQVIDATLKGGVLIVPGVASVDTWELAAATNQGPHRASSGEQ